jgi:hypothetical protein
VRPPDILPEFPVERMFRREMPSVSLSDLCFFRNGSHRFEDDDGAGLYGAPFPKYSPEAAGTR